MVLDIAKSLRAGLAAAFAAGLAFATVASTASAQQLVVKGEQYIPGIWIDPDGCEHWYMDDGAEGYMSPHTDRDGKPVCHRVNTCAVMNTDQLFATDRAAITASGRARLQEFFRSAGAISYRITGHTDSRASDEYNMRLSKRRAEAVASVARSVGAHVSYVGWYGERQPLVPNDSAANMQKNRRVEIFCVK